MAPKTTLSRHSSLPPSPPLFFPAQTGTTPSLIHSMAASLSVAEPNYGLFALPTLLSNLRRLTSDLNRSPMPPSSIQEQLRTLRVSLLKAADVIMASKTQLPAHLSSRLTHTIYAADDLVDDLEYRTLQEQIESSVIRTGEDDDVPNQASVGSEANVSLPEPVPDVSLKDLANGSNLSLESNGSDVRIVKQSHSCPRPLSVCHCKHDRKGRNARSLLSLFCCLGSIKGKKGIGSSGSAEGADSSSICAKLDTVFDFGDRSTNLDDRIMKIVESLDVVFAHSGDATRTTTLDYDLKTPPEVLYKDEDVLGYDDEREKLVGRLLQSSEESVCIIPIFGSGGVGKTTLAHSVYSDERIVKYFHSRVWICASDDLNAMRVAGVTADPPTSENQDRTELEKLEFIEKVLLDQLQEKRFLLVLDDVESIEWTMRFGSMKNCREGSKIVITARNEGVVDDRGKANKVVINGLNEDDFMSYFRTRAIGLEDPQNFPELQIIAKEIATKLKGSPLAAKAVGELLRTKFTSEHWTKVLGELLELEEDLTDIKHALRLCYWHLPPQLKCCFAYCSLFPKGYPFDVENLVSIWISQGFIQPEDSNRRMEDIGREYFDHLVSRSFFELPNYTRSYWKSKYHVMHDLFHDLAKSVGASECSRCDNKGRIHQTTSHLNIKSCDNVHQWKFFRSIIVNSMHDIDFKALIRIRVLDLSYSCITELPDSIGDCMHLRYLNLAGNSIIELPDSLCRLYHLQFLVVPDACLRLPTRVNNLINLRHLIARKEAIASIAGIGSLISLQELKVFNVRVNKGHEIGQLKRMRELRGQLCILNLDDIGKKEEVIEANLNDKTRIEKLQLKWRRWKRCKVRVDVQEVLECLKPSPGLKELEIHWFTGSTSPTWLDKQSLGFLRSLHLRGCESWQQLSPLAHLPSLEFLQIENMNATIDAGAELVEPFPSLKELWLADTSIFFKGLAFEEKCCKFFHQFKKLTATDCKSVKGLPPLAMLPSIEELEIKNCPDLESEFPECLKDLKSITILKISAPNLTSFPSEAMHHLKELEIDRCQNLVSWLAEDKEDSHHAPSLVSLSIIDSPLPTGPILLKFLTALQELKVDKCAKITSFTAEQKRWFANLTSLRILCITDCIKLSALPPDLNRFVSLEKLTIKGCPKLRSLPNNLPDTLKVLEIFKCNSVFMPWQDEEAPDWVKSIPYRSIA